jgi:tRNA threonylcarbamoyl adenosine modification protein (Sua5/YciO/YrdC/YwlC family)
MLISIHPETPQDRLVRQAVTILEKGGVIIYPTDTLYAFGCSIMSKKAVTQVAKLKNISPDKAQFSCICRDLSDIGNYGLQISTPVFKVLKQVLPGPYTFILKASREVPRHFQSKQKTIGVRYVDHPIAQAIVDALGHPLLSASIPMEPDTYWVDPRDLHDTWGNQVDLVIDGGMGDVIPSTVIDCSDDEFEIIREGKGDTSFL